MKIKSRTMIKRKIKSKSRTDILAGDYLFFFVSFFGSSATGVSLIERRSIKA